MNAVVAWFGAHFSELHPLLQALHRQGGVLCGSVDIEFGSGLAGRLGRRLAARLGLPGDPGPCPLEVRIAHDDGRLLWSRQFGERARMNSIFVPVGRYPDGYWLERTGPLTLVLGVDLSGGGWRWLPRQLRFKGIPLPAWLFPRSHAYKRIEDGLYAFSVAFTLPGFGQILRYSGRLQAKASADATVTAAAALVDPGTC